MKHFLPFLLLGSALNVSAATITWTGGGDDSNWSTPANWNLGRAPLNGDAIVLTSPKAGNMVNDLTGLQLDSITGSVTLMILNGNPIAVANGINVTSSGFKMWLNVDVKLLGNQTISLSGLPVQYNGTFDLNGFNLTIGAPGGTIGIPIGHIIGTGNLTTMVSFHVGDSSFTGMILGNGIYAGTSNIPNADVDAYGVAAGPGANLGDVTVHVFSPLPRHLAGADLQRRQPGAVLRCSWHRRPGKRVHLGAEHSDRTVHSHQQRWKRRCHRPFQEQYERHRSPRGDDMEHPGQEFQDHLHGG
jgi:hypothetical protein